VKNIAIFGCTGSVGSSAVRVLRNHPGQFRVLALAAGSQAEACAALARDFDAETALLGDEAALPELRRHLPPGIRSGAGIEALCAAAEDPRLDVLLCAIVGTAGLRPVLSALRAGKTVALASKEILVMAGELVMATAAAHGGRIIPVDSEHSALFQCLEGKRPEHIRRLLLTCSGGPFLRLPAEAFPAIRPEQALKHPTWVMGRKITIDSATLMNKALEVIEASHLFRIPPRQVEVVVHPQSIVHSMVEFTDATVLAQMSAPDMAFPVQYALTWPERLAGGLPPMDFRQLINLSFEAPDTSRFPSLDYAWEALETGGVAPAMLNAANEVAVAAFLEGRLDFPGIWRCVRAGLDAAPPLRHPDLDQILAADAECRALVRSLIG
jgi:1-deoxy-D-xylulose-5-phosphate reductoisomerase